MKRGIEGEWGEENDRVWRQKKGRKNVLIISKLFKMLKRNLTLFSSFFHFVYEKRAQESGLTQIFFHIHIKTILL